MDRQQPAKQQQLHVIWCVCGILGSLLLYGVLQVTFAHIMQDFFYKRQALCPAAGMRSDGRHAHDAGCVLQAIVGIWHSNSGGMCFCCCTKRSVVIKR